MASMKNSTAFIVQQAVIDTLGEGNCAPLGAYVQIAYDRFIKARHLIDSDDAADIRNNLARLGFTLRG